MKFQETAAGQALIYCVHCLDAGREEAQQAVVITGGESYCEEHYRFVREKLAEHRRQVADMMRGLSTRFDEHD